MTSFLRFNFPLPIFPLGVLPRRLVKPDEKINPGLKLAWAKQTQHLQTNAWNSVPTWIGQSNSDKQFPTLNPRKSQVTNNDDKSVATTTTVHLDNEEVTQMREQIDEMQKEISQLSTSYHKLLTSTTKNAISEAITKLPENVRNLNAKVKKLDTITKQQSADLSTLQEKQRDSDTNYNIQ